jgi:Holliday junction resolvase
MNEKERIASEAARLLNEPLLVEALDGIMADAFAEFKSLRVSQETLPDVIALQQRILVAHEIHDRIEAKITASGQRDGGVVVENKPTA